MPGRLILARHAQSTLDAEQRYSGHLDPELSKRGRREADALAFTLAMNPEIVLDRSFTSSRTAARRTAEVVMRRFVYRHDLEIVDALDERDYGELTGLTHAEALDTYGRSEVERRAHGAFSPDDPLARAMVTFHQSHLVPNLREAETLLVVSYDDNLRTLAAIIDGTPIEREPWRTGMALDYRFDDTMAVAAKDSMQSADWD